MTRGGPREGSGRPSKGIVRRAMVNLDARRSKLLTELEGELQLGSVSEVLLWCVETAHVKVFGERTGRK
jgi:hypothetical protein